MIGIGHRSIQIAQNHWPSFVFNSSFDVTNLGKWLIVQAGYHVVEIPPLLRFRHVNFA
ncbi:hypothetical protein BVRB_005970 [Beta vulgaris subsp. vulgaris]|uniref:Uncharacterized protein n=1 Tax=Beta vulgaris subsp. vulgaris TaxID=3555 RepID=A0A0J8B3G6_BETVV|nr:hypothetical protein BVRB_005970 [Beta vulgaris subsp. vulgaris]